MLSTLRVETDKEVYANHQHDKSFACVSIDDPEIVAGEKKKRPPMINAVRRLTALLTFVALALIESTLVTSGQRQCWLFQPLQVSSTSTEVSMPPHVLVALCVVEIQSPDSFMLRSMSRFLAASSIVSSRSFNTASSVSTTL
jgi:hypothetical protein